MAGGSAVISNERISAANRPASNEWARLGRVGRIDVAELRRLYFESSIHDLGCQAHAICEAFHPEDYRTYVVDRNINYANWCTAKCIFCDFKADPPEMPTGRRDLPSGYTLTFDQIGAKIAELVAIGGTQILMQGGLVPKDGSTGLAFDWYLDLMRFIRREFPTVHIHAFSPPEIWAFGELFDMPVRDVLLRLQEAGLHTVPGGGGEILSDRVRRRIAAGKTLSHPWLEVMRQAHAIGMRTSCTMMLGHIETLAERFEHFRLLRDLQDEALARGNGGGFSAFILWPFQPGNTPLGRTAAFPTQPNGESHAGSNGDADAAALIALAAGDPERGRMAWHRNRPVPDGRHLLLADAHEYLVMQALARIYFDNIPNIQASWVTMGPKIGQLALFFGANDMGSVMMEENVVSAAGTTFRLDEAEIRRLIADAGWTPRKRNYYYHPID
jgi:cyclic dehypoxanthinyl futalosine synthase